MMEKQNGYKTLCMSDIYGNPSDSSWRELEKLQSQGWHVIANMFEGRGGYYFLTLVHYGPYEKTEDD